MSEAPIELDPAVNSSALENVLEHVFLADLLQKAWFGRRQVVDVLHASVNAVGHDVILEPRTGSGDVVAKHSKANTVGAKQHRPDIRIVNFGKSERLQGATDVLSRLSGTHPS